MTSPPGDQRAVGGGLHPDYRPCWTTASPRPIGKKRRWEVTRCGNHDEAELERARTSTPTDRHHNPNLKTFVPTWARDPQAGAQGAVTACGGGKRFRRWRTWKRLAAPMLLRAGGRPCVEGCRRATGSCWATALDNGGA
jgi:hypothetical protein